MKEHDYNRQSGKDWVLELKYRLLMRLITNTGELDKEREPKTPS